MPSWKLEVSIQAQSSRSWSADQFALPQGDLHGNVKMNRRYEQHRGMVSLEEILFNRKLKMFVLLFGQQWEDIDVKTQPVDQLSKITFLIFASYCSAEVTSRINDSWLHSVHADR